MELCIRIEDICLKSEINAILGIANNILHLNLLKLRFRKAEINILIYVQSKILDFNNSIEK